MIGYLTIYNRKGFVYIDSTNKWECKYVFHDKKSITYRIYCSESYVSHFYNSLSVARDSGLKAFFKRN